MAKNNTRTIVHQFLFYICLDILLSFILQSNSFKLSVINISTNPSIILSIP